MQKRLDARQLGALAAHVRTLQDEEKQLADKHAKVRAEMAKKVQELNAALGWTR